MNDDVLAIAVSLDGKFIVVALLDSTIKVTVLALFFFFFKSLLLLILTVLVVTF